MKFEINIPVIITAKRNITTINKNEKTLPLFKFNNLMKFNELKFLTLLSRFLSKTVLLYNLYPSIKK